MMQGPGVFVPLVWTIVTDVFPQSPQNFSTEFCVHHLAWWNKFLMHDALKVKKNQH
jgi:hypothetical protein